MIKRGKRPYPKGTGRGNGRFLRARYRVEGMERRTYCRVRYSLIRVGDRTYITRNKHATTNLDFFQKQADFQGVSVGSQLGDTASNRVSSNRRSLLQDRYDVAAGGCVHQQYRFQSVVLKFDDSRKPQSILPSRLQV